MFSPPAPKALSIPHHHPASSSSSTLPFPHLIAQLVKNLPAMWETPVPVVGQEEGFLVQSLGWEDPLEKGKATHSSILAWRIPWTEEPGRLQSMGSQRVGHD